MSYPKTCSNTPADASSQMSVANETVLGRTKKQQFLTLEKKRVSLFLGKKLAKPQLKGSFEKNTKKAPWKEVS